MRTLEEKRRKQIERNKQSMEQYYWYKEHGICVKCKEYEAVPNKVKCEVCLLKESETAKKKIDNLTEEQKEERKALRREQERLRREKAKENGICTHCFKRKVVEGKNRCLDCIVKDKKRYIQKQKGKIIRSERKHYGLCYICGKASMYNKTLCVECFESRSSWMKDFNINHKENIEKWRYWNGYCGKQKV